MVYITIVTHMKVEKERYVRVLLLNVIKQNLLTKLVDLKLVKL